MCWRNTGEQLELFVYDSGAWSHYKRSPHYVPDYKIHNGSKGLATMHKLFKKGWKIIPDPSKIITGSLKMNSEGKWVDDLTK
jgi:hypothetical protein